MNENHKAGLFAESRQQCVPYVLQGSPCKIAHPSIVGEGRMLRRHERCATASDQFDLRVR